MNDIMVLYWLVKINFILTQELIFLFFTIVNLISGGYSTGVPPLPIPNREVKPGHVDGTA